MFLVKNHGFDVNLRDKSGRTPLSWAIRNKHTDIVRVLLEVDGVDVDLQDGESRTPLSLAATGGNLDVVRLLL